MIDETGEPRAKIMRDALDLYFSDDRQEIGGDRLDDRLPIDTEAIAEAIKSEIAPLIENSTRAIQTAIESNKPQTPVQIINKLPQPQEFIEYYPNKVKRKKKRKFWFWRR